MKMIQKSVKKIQKLEAVRTLFNVWNFMRLDWLVDFVRTVHNDVEGVVISANDANRDICDENGAKELRAGDYDGPMVGHLFFDEG